MARLIEDRRSEKDRRCPAGKPPRAGERRRADRRQFPPPHDAAAVSAPGRELIKAIDAYKKDRGLLRISVDELLDVMSSLGYRRA